MADIGHEFLTRGVGILHGGRHIVEGDSQLLHLLGLAVRRNADIQIAVGDLARSGGHVLNRLRLAVCEERRCEQSHGKHGQRRKHEDLQRTGRQLGDRLALHRHKHDALPVAVGRCPGQRHGHALLAVDFSRLIIQIGAFAVEQRLDLVGRELIADVRAALNVLRAQHDLAACIAKQDVVAGGGRGNGQRAQKIPARRHVVRDGARLREPHDGLRRSAQGAFTLPDDIVREQAPEGHAQQDGRRQQQTDDQRDLTAKCRAHGLLHLELVADAPDRFQVPLIRNALELLAQALDVHVDRARIAEVVKAPDLVEQLIARIDAVRR